MPKVTRGDAAAALQEAPPAAVAMDADGAPGAALPAKPAFAPLGATEAGSVNGMQFRRIPVPQNRLTPLKTAWLQLYKPITDHLKLDMRMNLKTKKARAAGGADDPRRRDPSSCSPFFCAAAPPPRTPPRLLLPPNPPPPRPPETLYQAGGDQDDEGHGEPRLPAEGGGLCARVPAGCAFLPSRLRAATAPGPSVLLLFP